MGCLVALAQCSIPSSLMPQWDAVRCFAYVPSHNSEQVGFVVSDLLAKGSMWADFDVVVFEGDIQSAFDNLSLDVVQEALSFWQVHPRIVAAMLHEMHSLTCEARAADVRTTKDIFFNACIRQGGSESPWLWNLVMRYVMVRVSALWGPDAGVKVDTTNLTHMLWADNIWLFAHSLADLAQMSQCLTDVLDSACLFWKPSSLKAMGPRLLPGMVAFPIHSSRRTIPDLARNFEISTVADISCTQLDVVSVASMRILGTEQSRMGETCVAVDWRLQRATSAFWSHKEILLNRTIPLRERLWEFMARAQPVALFGCASWVLSRALVLRVQSWERGCLRRVVGVRRRGGELFVDFHRRSTRMALQVACAHGYNLCASEIARTIHRFAGSIAQDAQSLKLSLSLAAAVVGWIQKVVGWTRTSSGGRYRRQPLRPLQAVQPQSQSVMLHRDGPGSSGKTLL